MAKHYALTFLPWIALAVVSGVSDAAGALAGLAAALVLLAVRRRGGHRPAALVLEYSSAVYMAVLSAVALAAPDAAALRYGASLAIGWLALTAWGGLAIGRPFTEGIARRRVTAEIAARPLFRRIMVTVTAVWAAGFTVTALALAAVQYAAPHQTALLIACKVAGFALPAAFTARYPEHARKRHFAANGIPESAYAPAH
ncbi:hypothetical protein [Actinomadura parmotrematis]|uniref:DUF3159 domain-containing protein n=1 Tax=Actinomadura parmotrematis TaxID=2864039 RepID=A0ABS7FTZ9_9ACTN|nr:hypothetical protein [Actinomadura parmotrematis]MBW8483883.1 hypothetical protein [Actinomadura parmotrematis]